MKNETRKMVRTEGCPACSHKLGYVAAEGRGQLHTCAKCGAIFGSLYLGDSYGVVKPYFHFNAEAVPQDRIRYFDFTTLGSEGLGRRHGWYDTLTGLIIQVG